MSQDTENTTAPGIGPVDRPVRPLPEPYMFLPHSDGPMPLYRATDLHAAVEAQKARMLAIAGGIICPCCHSEEACEAAKAIYEELQKA